MDIDRALVDTNIFSEMLKGKNQSSESDLVHRGRSAPPGARRGTSGFDDRKHRDGAESDTGDRQHRSCAARQTDDTATHLDDGARPWLGLQGLFHLAVEN